MRAASTAASCTIHVGLIAVAVWATAREATPTARPPRVFHLPPLAGATPPTTPAAPVIPDVPDETVAIPAHPTTFDPDTLVPRGPAFPADPLPGRTSPVPLGPGWDGAPIDAVVADDPPMLLAGPAPDYPELLRQAGVEGRVVLEAVVDTTGRVEPGSIGVVAATNPAFVAPARRALAGALFRPARVRGRAVRVRIRLPTAFVLRRNR
jgi:periplasmic protein TonB